MKIKFNSDDDLPLNKTIKIKGLLFMKVTNIIHKFSMNAYMNYK